jgi:hypothetical protein
MIKHLILDLILFLTIIICPWWGSVIFALFLLYYLKFFNEIVIFGLITDIFYGSFSATFNLWDYKFTLLFLVLLLSSFFIKKRLKFYNR